MQQLQPIEIAGPPVPPCDRYWQLWANGKKVGKVTSAAWSPDFDVNVAIGMVRMTHWDPGTDLEGGNTGRYASCAGARTILDLSVL